MDDCGKVLVVGSTTDYIDWISRACPGQALFVTAPPVRQLGGHPPPAPGEELLVELEEFATVRSAIQHHLAAHRLSLSGIVCFDGESLELTAKLAAEFSLPYPTPESVATSQDKYLAKTRWAESQLPCPQARLVDSAAGVFAFLQELDAPCVLKPIAASGSELVFLCAGKRDGEKWLPIIQAGVAGQGATPAEKNATLLLAEEFIAGTEYSCDFLAAHGQARVLRLTRKLPAPRQPFGTIMAYALLEFAAAPFSREELEGVLGPGAAALGLNPALCMVDFIATAEGLVLLEMTPRPGGDCLPHLLRRARNLDILALALDFARQRPPLWPEEGGEGYVGLRLHARRAGEIRAIDSLALRRDERVREVHLTCQPGQKVTLPPADYLSWYLGHVIFEAAPAENWQAQCGELGKLLTLAFD